jgi:hypothetical protein
VRKEYAWIWEEGSDRKGLIIGFPTNMKAELVHNTDSVTTNSQIIYYSSKANETFYNLDGGVLG